MHRLRYIYSTRNTQRRLATRSDSLASLRVERSRPLMASSGSLEVCRSDDPLSWVKLRFLASDGLEGWI